MGGEFEAERDEEEWVGRRVQVNFPMGLMVDG